MTFDFVMPRFTQWNLFYALNKNAILSHMYFPMYCFESRVRERGKEKKGKTYSIYFVGNHYNIANKKVFWVPMNRHWLHLNCEASSRFFTIVVFCCCWKLSISLSPPLSLSQIGLFIHLLFRIIIYKFPLLSWWPKNTFFGEKKQLHFRVQP